MTGRPVRVGGRWALATTAATTFALGLPACGAGSGSDDGGSLSGSSGELRIAAAASLTDAFEAYGDQGFPEVAFSFAGSDELAAQIRQGAPVDVFASANTSYPDDLYDEGLAEKPVEFATNEMVIGVPPGSDIDAIDDLAEPGADIVLGTPDVPFGSYAREVLGRLPETEEEAILANVRSEESDVTAAVGKLSQDAADASLVYSSDVAGADGAIEGIELPADLQPSVTYGVAVVSGGENAAGARVFVDGLTEPQGQRILADAGFGPPPGG